MTGNYGLGAAIAHLLLDSILADGIYYVLKYMDVIGTMEVVINEQVVSSAAITGEQCVSE